jgi:hypothetical protein
LVGEKKANGGERDLNRVWENTEVLENKGCSEMERVKRVELQTASSCITGEITTADTINTGGEVAPTPFVKKLVASV